MSRWPEVTLGEVLRHRKEFIEIDDLQRYRRPRVQLHAQGVVLRDEVEGAAIKTKKQQVCRVNELLIAEIDAKVGGYGLVPSELNGAIVSSHYFLFAVDEAKLDPRYLGWYVKTPAFGDQVDAQGSTNYAAIRPQHVLDYTMPLPPIEEQRRVVRKLDQLAVQLERAGTAAPVGYDMALVTSFLRSVFRWHQARFEQVPLGELCYFENGDRSANYPSKSVRTSIGVPFINGGHMVDDGIDMTSMDFIPRDRFDLLSNGKTKPGDILFCLRGSLGKCTCVGDLPEGAIASSLVIVRPGERVLGSYVLAFLRSPLCSELVDRFKNGAAQPNLSARSLKMFPVPVPPLEEQATVVRAVARLRERAHYVELLGQWRRMAFDALHASLLGGALT